MFYYEHQGFIVKILLEIRIKPFLYCVIIFKDEVVGVFTFNAEGGLFNLEQFKNLLNQEIERIKCKMQAAGWINDVENASLEQLCDPHWHLIQHMKMSNSVYIAKQSLTDFPAMW